MTDLFYSEEQDDIDHAKSICDTCENQSSCLESALTSREPFGVWGGSTPDERYAILRARYRAKRSGKLVVY
jgi:Transcription factor WhiB